MNRRRQGLRTRLALPAWLRALPERLRGLARVRLRRTNRRTWRIADVFERGAADARATPSAPAGLRPHDSEAAPPWREVGFAAAWLIPVGLLILAFATPVLGQQAVDSVRTSRHFQVREVVVSGHRRLPEGEVLQLAGIRPGMSVLEADVDALAAPLRAHPWIRWARVARELPATLRVDLIEREACAYLATGDLWFVDETGEVFAPADPVESLDIPMISGVDRETLAAAVTDPVKRMQLQVRLQGALNLARTWRIHGLARRYPIGELRLDPVRGYVIVAGARGTTPPVEVVLGEGPFREKLLRLEFTLEALRAEGRNAEYALLDVGDDGSPAVHEGSRPPAKDVRGARVIVRATDPEEDAAVAVDRAAQGPASAVGPPNPAPVAAARPTPNGGRSATVGQARPAGPDPADTPEVAPLTGGRPADITAGMEEQDGKNF